MENDPKNNKENIDKEALKVNKTNIKKNKTKIKQKTK
jgi:hypothetical protein